MEDKAKEGEIMDQTETEIRSEVNRRYVRALMERKYPELQKLLDEAVAIA